MFKWGLQCLQINIIITISRVGYVYYSVVDLRVTLAGPNRHHLRRKTVVV